jgi:hypothetical protein
MNKFTEIEKWKLIKTKHIDFRIGEVKNWLDFVVKWVY